MNKVKLIALLFCIISVSTLWMSCSDNSVTTTTKNTATFTQNGLKHLDPAVEGVYELWVSIPSSAPNTDHGDSAFKSLGRFNIDASTGNIVSLSGQAMTFSLAAGLNANNAEDAILTLRLPGDNGTIPQIRMLGGLKNTSGSSLIFNLNMDYEEVMGTLSDQFPSSTAKYLLASPTTGTASSQYQKGLWFTHDTSGVSDGLTLPVLSDTLEWTYQAWVVDTVNLINYNMGRFDNPGLPDDNQSCGGGQTGWNKPGNDWIQAGCPSGLPQITDLTSGPYKIMITLEPRHETNSLPNPFYLKLFYGSISPSSFGTVINLTNVTAIPTGVITLSAN